MKIKRVLNNGLSFINKEQTKDNYFGMDTLFPLILIFDCLNEVELESSQIIKEKIKGVLLTEKSKYWSFNYWKKNSLKQEEEPYPDDLDDTCCALAALYRFNKTIINGGVLSKIINLFLICENETGGPYRTWILPKEKSKKWDDIDLAVNSNVAYFLSLQKIKLKNIQKLIENKIKNNQIQSPFYKGELGIIYFISRFYQGKLKTVLKQKLVEQTKNTKTALDMALILSSLIRLGYKKTIKKEWIEFLIDKQLSDGSWPADDFYFYVDKKSNNKYIGGKSLSTAFSLEAISLFKKSISKSEIDKYKISSFKKKILKELSETFKRYPKQLKTEISEQLSQIVKRDKDGTITAIPLFIYKSLLKEKQKLIDDDFILSLGKLSLLGWCAYTIYDGIIDEDIYKDKLITANILSKEMDFGFRNLEIKKETGFFNLYQEIMQNMEVANWNELNNLRFNPELGKIKIRNFDVEKIAQKSMGYAICSVAILCKLGLNIKSLEVINILNYFKYQIIAKQMNDDAHDWWSDFVKGQINSANYQIIKRYKGNLMDIKIKAKKKQLELEYWQKVIPKICRKIIYFSRLANSYAEKLNLIKNFYLLKINQKNIAMAQNTLNECKNTVEFINNYYI